MLRYGLICNYHLCMTLSRHSLRCVSLLTSAACYSARQWVPVTGSVCYCEWESVTSLPGVIDRCPVTSERKGGLCHNMRPSLSHNDDVSYSKSETCKVCVGVLTNFLLVVVRKCPTRSEIQHSGHWEALRKLLCFNIIREELGKAGFSEVMT